MRDYPKNLQPVLAKLSHRTENGYSEWSEVVYYDDQIRQKWCAYAGSKTFQDGERVIKWRYVSDCFNEVNEKYLKWKGSQNA